MDLSHHQHHLETVYQQHGLEPTLELLYQNNIELGFIEPERLNDNVWFCHHHPDYPFAFQTQINYLRHHYQTHMANNKASKPQGCPLCHEHIGIGSKKNLRAFSFSLSNAKPFFIHPTPYPLHPKHFVLIDHQHTPMRMCPDSVNDLLSLVDLAPNYTACSNSDIAMAGASILEHHHYQIFHELTLPIESAPPFKRKTLNLSLIHI